MHNYNNNNTNNNNNNNNNGSGNNNNNNNGSGDYKHNNNSSSSNKHAIDTPMSAHQLCLLLDEKNKALMGRVLAMVDMHTITQALTQVDHSIK